MRKSSKVENYQSKQVFVGIDVHKRTYTIASFADGIVIKKWTTLASSEKLGLFRNCREGPLHLVVS